MSQYYTPNKTRGLFSPRSKEPFVISRTGIALFLECPRCFYLEKRLGTGRPPGFPFSLNAAVDTLLKKEFDLHRARGTPHPLMKAYGINAVPYAHEQLEEWRDARTRGIKFLHEPTNMIVRGGIDDVWAGQNGELHIVDYKATSKNSAVNLDAQWQDGYKRQAEVYQWLFRENEFDVSDTAYFVYCNGKADKEAFDGKLEFDVTIIPYKGSTEWVEKTLFDIKECLLSSSLPEGATNCDFCRYFSARASAEARA